MLKRDIAAIREFEPEVILAREDAYCTSIVHAAKTFKIPFVTYADVPVAYETRLFHSDARWHPPFLVERIERWWLKNSQAVITPCHPAADELKVYQLNVPIYVTPNGVVPEKFSRLTPNEKLQKLAEIGVPPGSTVIGFQGSFRKFHGIDLLREMILRTVNRPDIHWLLIGDGPERAPLQDAVAGCHSVTFMGKQPPENMGDLTSLFDIAVSSHMFINGSFYFCPLKILEYAAAGCAIIASTQGDIPRLLDDGRVGVLVDRPDPESWVNAIEGLLDDVPRMRQLGRSAREFVTAHLTWRHTAERIEVVLKNALSVAPQALSERSLEIQRA
jgi:glycosyltransferase involved in cell wall biosynthesis